MKNVKVVLAVSLLLIISLFLYYFTIGSKIRREYQGFDEKSYALIVKKKDKEIFEIFEKYRLTLSSYANGKKIFEKKFNKILNLSDAKQLYSKYMDSLSNIEKTLNQIDKLDAIGGEFKEYLSSYRNAINLSSTDPMSLTVSIQGVKNEMININIPLNKVVDISKTIESKNLKIPSELYLKNYNDYQDGNVTLEDEGSKKEELKSQYEELYAVLSELQEDSNSMELKPVITNYQEFLKKYSLENLIYGYKLSVVLFKGVEPKDFILKGDLNKIPKLKKELQKLHKTMIELLVTTSVANPSALKNMGNYGGANYATQIIKNHRNTMNIMGEKIVSDFNDIKGVDKVVNYFADFGNSEAERAINGY